MVVDLHDMSDRWSDRDIHDVWNELTQDDESHLYDITGDAENRIGSTFREGQGGTVGGGESGEWDAADDFIAQHSEISNPFRADDEGPASSFGGQSIEDFVFEHDEPLAFESSVYEEPSFNVPLFGDRPSNIDITDPDKLIGALMSGEDIQVDVTAEILEAVNDRIVPALQAELPYRSGALVNSIEAQVVGRNKVIVGPLKGLNASQLTSNPYVDFVTDRSHPMFYASVNKSVRNKYLDIIADNQLFFESRLNELLSKKVYNKKFI